MIFIIKKTLLLTTFLLAALLVACDAEPTPEAPQEQETPQETMPEAAAPQEEDGALDGLQDELRQSFMSFAQLEPNYHVTYDLSTQTTSESYTGTMDWYVMGQDNMRIDSTMQAQGMTVESRTYMLGEELISCMQQEGSWRCFLFSSDDDMFDADEGTGFTESIDTWEEEVDALEFLETSTRTIAGEQATCFTFVDAGQTQELCYASSGALLYVASEFPQGSQVMEATSYSSSVSSSDFNPPAEPQDMAAMFEGMGDFDSENW